MYLKRNPSSQILKGRPFIFFRALKDNLYTTIFNINDDNNSYYCYITQLKQLDEIKAAIISMQLHCRKYVTTPEVSNFKSNYGVERVLYLSSTIFHPRSRLTTASLHGKTVGDDSQIHASRKSIVMEITSSPLLFSLLYLHNNV